MRKLLATLALLVLLGTFLIPVAPAYAAWLGTWAYRIEITTDDSVIDSNLSHFPLTIMIDSSSGKTSTDLTAVFDELTSDANRFKIAVTESDGTSQLEVEIEYWSDASETAILHVSDSGWSLASAGETLYLYYDSAQSDNTTYVKDYNSAVWDSDYEAVYHMSDHRAPSITVTDQGIVFDADDVIGGAGDYCEDAVVLEGDDGLFYMFTDQYDDGGSSDNDHIYVVSASDAAFTTDLDYISADEGVPMINVDNLRVFAAIFDDEDDEYIIYCCNWVLNNRYTKAYKCPKADFEAGDGGTGDWSDEGTALSLGAGGTWDDATAYIFDVTWTGSTWQAFYHGTDGTSRKGIGYATSADPLAEFTKGANGGLLTIYNENQWHGAFYNHSMRSFYHGLSDYYIGFAEGGILGSDWQVGAHLIPKSDPTIIYGASNTPQIGDVGVDGYANCNSVITSGGTNYVYYNSTKVGEATDRWYDFRVGTFTAPDTTYSASDDESLINCANHTNGTSLVFKASDEPDEATGLVGFGQDYDGTDDDAFVIDYSDLDFALTDPFTLEVVVDTTKVTNGVNQRLIAKSDVGDSLPNYQIRLNGDGSKSVSDFRIHDGSHVPTVNGTANMADGSPHYIVGVRSPTGVDDELRLYEDGAFINNTTDSTTATLANAGDLWVGAWEGTGSYTDGIIDEVRISSAERSAAWIKATNHSLKDSLLTYNAPTSPPEAPKGFGPIFFSPFGII